ncbi:hypothetical protein CWC15_10340 [Pseudoalteromonas spongiae]|nr:hypothetical protein CWC15_10340 [Pseudoalteromonas spongiae]
MCISVTKRFYVFIFASWLTFNTEPIEDLFKCENNSIIGFSTIVVDLDVSSINWSIRNGP